MSCSHGVLRKVSIPLRLRWREAPTPSGGAARHHPSFPSAPAGHDVLRCSRRRVEALNLLSPAAPIAAPTGTVIITRMLEETISPCEALFAAPASPPAGVERTLR